MMSLSSVDHINLLHPEHITVHHMNLLHPEHGSVLP